MRKVMKDRYIKIVSFFAILLSVIAFSACEVDDKVELVAGVLPKVTTLTPSQLSEKSAVVGGTVTSGGGLEVRERGIVYSTKQNPTISNLSNTIRPCGSGTGEFGEKYRRGSLPQR